MDREELLAALAEIAEKVKAEPLQIGEVKSGGLAWWCHLCEIGDHISIKGESAEVIIGKAAVAHVLGVDHEAQKILAESP